MGEAVERLIQLTTVTVPVVAHPRQTKRGIEKVDAHTRKIRLKGIGVKADKTLDEKGGFSISSNGHEPKGGFMVAVPDAEEQIGVDEATPERLAAYMDKHEAQLSEEGNFFGGWLDRDSGKVYLDISRNVKDEKEARSLGKKWKQLAIFNLNQLAEVRLSRRNAREVVYLPKDDPKAAAEELRKLIDKE